MISDYLIKDKDKQARLKSNTKFLVEETLTIIIGIFQGKDVEQWSDSDKEMLEKYIQFTRKEFIDKRDGDGKYIIEYSDAVTLLENYYASKIYGSQLKERIVKEQKENAEFVEKIFRNDYDKQCEKEREILKNLRVVRNKEFAHAIKEANMGEIYMWIRELMKYIDCFSGYRMQVLSKYDSRFGKKEDQKKLLYTGITRAKKTTYLITTEEALAKAVDTVETGRRYSLFFPLLTGETEG